MRKILIRLGVAIAFLAVVGATWIFAGRYVTLFVDRFGTVETASQSIKSISYEGSGTDGILHVNDLALSLRGPNPQSSTPHIGSTKDNQLALAIAGKIFAFGPLRQTEGDTLATEPADGDYAVMTIRHSALSWPTPFDINFMTGQSPSWRRHLYYELSWKRQSGAKLDMLWRFEQYFYTGNGWLGDSMTYERDTGLIRVDIRN